MPLTNCPDCGREISTAAPACPQCGRPNGPAVTPVQMPVAQIVEEKLWHGSPSWLLLLGKIIWLAVVALVLPGILFYVNGHYLPDPQFVRVLWFIIAALIVWRAVSVIIALARVRSTTYTLTNQRITIESGIMEKKLEDIDLRYIDDTVFRQRIVERMLGIGNVMIVSSDKTTPTFVLRGIADPRALRELIRARAYEASQRQLFTRAT